MGSLSEVREKFNRSEQNIQDLKRFLPGRDPQTPGMTHYVATIETQADGETQDIFIDDLIASLDLRLAIGNVLHDIRTSLDHLVYQLALRAGFPASNRTADQLKSLRSLQFLIYDDPHRFSSAAGKVRKVIGCAPVTEMERLQQYKGLDPRGKIIWTLSELDNITKHRLIVALDPTPIGAKIAFVAKNGVRSPEVLAKPIRDTLKNRTKLFSFRLSPSIAPHEVDVDVKAISKIVFADTDGLCDGANVFDVMRDSQRAVGSIIDDFEKLFF